MDDKNELYGTLSAVTAIMRQWGSGTNDAAEMDGLDVLAVYWSYTLELITEILDGGVHPGEIPVLKDAVNAACAALKKQITVAASNTD